MNLNGHVMYVIDMQGTCRWLQQGLMNAAAHGVDSIPVQVHHHSTPCEHIFIKCLLNLKF